MESLICLASKAKSFLECSLSVAIIIEISGTQIMSHDLLQTASFDLVGNCYIQLIV